MDFNQKIDLASIAPLSRRIAINCHQTAAVRRSDVWTAKRSQPGSWVAWSDRKGAKVYCAFDIWKAGKDEMVVEEENTDIFNS